LAEGQIHLLEASIEASGDYDLRPKGFSVIKSPRAALRLP